MIRRVLLIVAAILALCSFLQADKAAKHKGKQVAKPTEVAPAQQVQGCPVTEIVQAATGGAEDIVDYLQRFSATERVEHTEVDKHGNAQPPKVASFSYMAEIHDYPAMKSLGVDEYRDGSTSLDNFPTNLANKGLAALALLFHPDYVGDFTFQCEGFTDVRGKRAWQLHFLQHRTNTFRGYRVHGVWYPVKLEGRAWISTDDAQVLRLESELAEPIPQIELKHEHVLIDYTPVEFARQKVRLWLPESAEVTIAIHGKSFRQTHAFSDFKLYWVDTVEKRKAPVAPPPDGPGQK